MLDLKEEYGSLDGVDVSIDGADIPLFLKSLNIFVESILVLLSLLNYAVIKIKASYVVNAPT